MNGVLFVNDKQGHQPDVDGTGACCFTRASTGSPAGSPRFPELDACLPQLGHGQRQLHISARRCRCSRQSSSRMYRSSGHLKDRDAHRHQPLHPVTRCCCRRRAPRSTSSAISKRAAAIVSIVERSVMASRAAPAEFADQLASAGSCRATTGRRSAWFWTIDRPLLVMVLMLIGCGALAVAAASPAAAHRYSGGSIVVGDLYYLKRARSCGSWRRPGDAGGVRAAGEMSQAPGDCRHGVHHRRADAGADPRS